MISYFEKGDIFGFRGATIVFISSYVYLVSFRWLHISTPQQANMTDGIQFEADLEIESTI